MPIRNQNWYNLQSTRRYPLDDTSTGLDDAGAFIRDDIVVDCHIRFPAAFGAYLYLQGLTVSQGIVTAVFGAVDAVDATSGKTVCAVSVRQPVSPYVHYSVTPFVPGVSGWVVFGEGINTAFSGRYTLAKQTLIQSRNARPYEPLPIPTIGKLNVGTALSDIVSVIGTAPIKAEYKTIAYDGDNYPAIVFKLDDSLTTTAYNALQQFLGPCGQRPESGTCAKTPIETINGVSPDCAGNINIVFDGFGSALFENCGGIDITTDISLSVTCAANKPKKPQEFQDECCSFDGKNIFKFENRAAFPAVGELNQLYLAFDSNKVYSWTGADYEETDVVVDAYCWPDPTIAIDLVVDETLDEQNYPCLNAPLCVDFDSCQPNEYFITKTGIFNTRQTLAPPVCGNCSIAEFEPDLGSTLTDHNTYMSASIGGRNVALLKNCATDWALNKTIMTEFKIGVDGVARNGGLVLNYVETLDTGRVITTYIAIVLDATKAKARILRYTDGIFTEEFAVNYNAKVNNWYRLYANLNQNGNNLSVSFSAAKLDGSQPISGFTDLIDPGPITGAAGLFANQSATFFNKFVVQ